MQKHVGLLLAISSALALAAACGGSSTAPVGSSGGSSGSSGTSGSSGATDDGGTTCTDPSCDPGALDSGLDPTSPTVCTSGATWTRGDRGSSLMHPGVACINCHDSGRGPAFTIAGTVYPSVHEPDDCNGIVGTGTTVVITDKAGKVTTIPVNSVGNFYSAANIATPFQAKVVKGGAERVMIGAQTNGDCNSCHTVKGSSAAPGRIVAP